MKPTILVVDDEKPIAEILQYNLEKEEFRVVVAFDGEEALQRFEQESPHLVILDIMLPKIDGLAVCRAIRARSDTPIIMLTAKEAEFDKVLGLEMGADDYVTKPFSAREVIARIRAILRRGRRGAGMALSPPSRLEQGDLAVDLDLMETYVRGKPVDLTYREFSLLVHLMARPGHVFTRQQLLNQVWGYDYVGDERTVDVTVRRLREKIERDPGDPEYIQTKRGVGYYFRRAPHA